MIGLVTASTTAFTLVTIWQCHPLQAFWNRKIPGGRCFDSEAFWFSYSLINILLDVAILVLPVRQVLKLHVNKKEKFSLVAVFLLGILYESLISHFRFLLLINCIASVSQASFVPRLYLPQQPPKTQVGTTSRPHSGPSSKPTRVSSVHPCLCSSNPLQLCFLVSSLDLHLGARVIAVP